MKKQFVFHLTNDERDKIKCSIECIHYSPEGSSPYIMDVKLALLTSLPDRFTRFLLDQKASLKPAPYFIIENAPKDDEVFMTPSHDLFSIASKTGCVSENFMVGIAAIIGEPYSIRFEGETLVNNLIPEIVNRMDYSGLGSAVELDFHIENAALKHLGEENFSPMGLMLAGVRHDPKGPKTRISEARLALDMLTACEIEVLRKSFFRIKIPYRWRKIAGREIDVSHVPLMQGTRDFPDLSAAFYPDMVESLNDEAEQAFRSLYSAVKEVSFDIDIQPGMLAYIDNRLAFHSRDAFEPSVDSDKRPLRWIQRVFVAPHLWNHRHLTQINGRIFEPHMGASS